MTTLTNSISIDAPLTRVWAILANLAELADYDPTVRSAQVSSTAETGVGSSRKVTMRDGKHWFEERVTTFQPSAALAFELTSCNFPISRLNHSYRFSEVAGNTTVIQEMAYTPKFGLLGKLMDAAMLRRSFSTGVNAFLGGLKKHAEAQTPAST